MLDDKKRAEFDQARAAAGEALPALWKSLWEGLEKDFPEDKAWELLKIVVYAQSGGKMTII